ncbi:IclR family transcriptional regulator [Herbiconiux sp. KACC 21604]|uniref:IclR family transcriptional regulator n=1 Tax=unclassified Herbiconiux TaxID=2618217 RepID=UPI0014921931|nr:IclR family transcriptional regulator [Herbiconiux sp. SALV-R1]QJU54741.1 IclR family transcriptional regulator [Herbiconiux sp. SALV-R1]WPO85848.1 IclR family transcriptional regulator [Herbiconiux sp. KACC 21604]
MMNAAENIDDADEGRLDEMGAPAPAPAEAQRTKGVDSARRALQILLEFSESTPELTVDNVLEKHDISVPSAYRYISLLRELDLIEEREKGRFVLSPQIFRLARAAETTIDFRGQVQPILNRMAEETGETALYLRRVNDSAVCLAMAESDHPISISFQPGTLMPLYGGAAAKLLLSELPPPKLAQYFNRLGPVLSKQAKTKLERDLEPLRETGYAESAGEVDRGVWAAAASVQTNGITVGALTIVAPDYRLSDEHKAQIAECVRWGAKEFRTAIADGH